MSSQLRKALLSVNLDLVKSLIKEGHDPSYDDNEGLMITSQNGLTEFTKELLKDPRVNPSCNDNYPVRISVSEGHLDDTKLLLQDPRTLLNFSNKSIEDCLYEIREENLRQL